MGWKPKASTSLAQVEGVRAVAYCNDSKPAFFFFISERPLITHRSSRNSTFVASENLHQALWCLAGVQQPAFTSQDALMPSHHPQPLRGPLVPCAPQPAAHLGENCFVPPQAVPTALAAGLAFPKNSPWGFVLLVFPSPHAFKQGAVVASLLGQLQARPPTCWLGFVDARCHQRPLDKHQEVPLVPFSPFGRSKQQLAVRMSVSPAVSVSAVRFCEEGHPAGSAHPIVLCFPCIGLPPSCLPLNIARGIVQAPGGEKRCPLAWDRRVLAVMLCWWRFPCQVGWLLF